MLGTFLMSEGEYRELAADNGGLCLECGVEVHGVEPDARGYECESCGEPAVFGADELLLMGKIEFCDERGQS